MKTCSNPNCIQINPQPTMNFNKNKFYKDGLQHRCRICQKLINHKYRITHEKEVKEYRKKRYYKNITKEAEYKKKYRKLKPHKHANSEAKRRATKLQATPKWLTKEQLKEIENMYKNCPPGFHVDHICPLQGKDSCGLHVPWNLQILPAKDNLKKGNKLIV